MSTSPPDPSRPDLPNPLSGSAPFPQALGAGVEIIRVTTDLVVPAAARLVGDQSDDPLFAAHRFLENADRIGIDLSLLWATITRSSFPAKAQGGQTGAVQVRQVCLAVLGSGRTAMLFVSGAARRARRFKASADLFGSPANAADERCAVIQTACQHVSAENDLRPAASLAQALLEEREKDALAAFRLAGFTQVGDLAYLRRATPARGSPVALPDDVRIFSFADLLQTGTPERDLDAMLMRVLDRSYIDTLDCPELCGLRTPEEVLESHRAVGRYDPSIWWLIFAGEQPVGCMLFNVLPEQESVELVYLGLDPIVRGRGLGRTALTLGLRHLWGQPHSPNTGVASADLGRVLVGSGGVTCAVDTRNTAALRLYRAAGFERFAVRVPVVMGLRTSRA